MIRKFSFYNRDTGLFASGRFGTTDHEGCERDAELNCPPGFLPMEGEFDAGSQRVDIATGAVVPYVPPAQAPDPGIQRAGTLAAIVSLEAKQHRLVRELALNPRDRQALEKLSALDAEVAGLRAKL